MFILFNLYLLGSKGNKQLPWIFQMISAITRNPEEKVDKKLQIEDTRRLLNLLKAGEIRSDDLISEFSRKYSAIATERILNYYFGTICFQKKALILRR